MPGHKRQNIPVADPFGAQPGAIHGASGTPAQGRRMGGVVLVCLVQDSLTPCSARQELQVTFGYWALGRES